MWVGQFFIPQVRFNICEVAPLAHLNIHVSSSHHSLGPCTLPPISTVVMGIGLFSEAGGLHRPISIIQVHVLIREEVNHGYNCVYLKFGTDMYCALTVPWTAIVFLVLFASGGCMILF